MLDGIRRRGRDFASDWAGPIVLALITAAAVWTVWHFTKAPCTTTAAENGVCNPGIIARFINVEILLQSGGAALAVGALKGGYDRYMMRRMLNEERELRLQAEQQLADERKRVADERKRADETIQMVAQLVSDFREEHRQAAEERRQAAEERRLNVATQQALLDTLVRLNERGNGRSENGN